MSNNNHNKPNYNDAKHYNEYYDNQSSYNQQMHSTNASCCEKHDSIYRDDEVSGKDFIIGVLVGGVIGAVTALLITPKSGIELRGNISTQALQLKDKTKDFSSTAKEKTTQLSKQLQEQSGQLVDKVKSIKGVPSSPLDDGTVSSEGEEPMEYMETISHTSEEVTVEQEENTTAIAEAIKDAVVNDKSNK